MTPWRPGCRLPWLTNSALVYEPKSGRRWVVAGSQPMSTVVHRSPNKHWRFNSILKPCSIRIIVIGLPGVGAAKCLRHLSLLNFFLCLQHHYYIRFANNVLRCGFFIIKLRHRANQEFAIIAPRGPRSSKDSKKVKSTLSYLKHGGFCIMRYCPSFFLSKGKKPRARAS